MDISTLRARLHAIARDLDDPSGEGDTLLVLRAKVKALRQDVNQLQGIVQAHDARLDSVEARLDALEALP